MFFGGDPFEHFAHGHGGGGGRGGGGGGRASAPVDTTKLYETLGIEKTADEKEIKTAYRKLSLKHHPDRGGDADVFKTVNAAYEILSDPEKRVKYDKYGLEGLEEGGGRGGGGSDDLFSMFFGGGRRGGGQQQRGPRKSEDVQHPLKVSLEDLYNGKTVKLAVHRTVLVGDSKKCQACNGQGVVMELRQIALGMVQQIQRRCSECSGQGIMCNSKKERKVLEVNITKGMQHNQTIKFVGLADEKPEMETGDIVFVVQEKEHALYKRKGADLLVTKTVSLNEALCGFSWPITHLDGRKIIIKSQPGEIIMPEAASGQPFMKCVPNEGMPTVANPFVKGRLFVLFRVEFPTDGALSKSVVEALTKLLPNPCAPLKPEDLIDEHGEPAEECQLEAADVKLFGKSHQDHGHGGDSDEEEGAGRGGAGGGVQCAQS